MSNEIRELAPRIREKYESLEDKRLLWELIKMEIRDNTISFAKRKSGMFSSRKQKFLSNWKTSIIKYVIVIIYQT